MKPYDRIADVYDAVYQVKKNYAEEAARIWELTQAAHSLPRGRTSLSLLDVACGTGLHLQQLSRWFAHVEGIDLNERMLAVARKRLASVRLSHADMLDFDLGRRFDVVTCLFSSIGHMTRLPELRRAIWTMTSHVEPGGVLFVEPWLSPADFRPGTVHAYLVETAEMTIAHVNVSTLLDGRSVHEMHYLVGRSTGVASIAEVHELGLYTRDQYCTALEDAGLSVAYDQEGLDGRGLFTGVKSTSTSSPRAASASTVRSPS